MDDSSQPPESLKSLDSVNNAGIYYVNTLSVIEHNLEEYFEVSVLNLMLSVRYAMYILGDSRETMYLKILNRIN